MSISRLSRIFSIAVLLFACSKKEVATNTPAPAEPEREKGVVGGSVSFAPPNGDAFPVRDFEVELREGSNVVAKAKSDPNGIFVFSDVPAAKYKVCWNAQGGWSAGCGPHEAQLIQEGVAYGPVRVTSDATKGRVAWGHVAFADGNAAVEIEPLFGIEVYPRVTVAGGPSVLTNLDGDYVLAGIPASATALIVADEKVTISHAFDSKAAVDITLPNKPPRTADEVIVAQPGSMVTLSAKAIDADGDPLAFRWTIEGTAMTEAKGPTAQWRAPQKPGLYDASVLAADGKGGYDRKDIVVAVARGQTCAKPTTFFTCPPPTAGAPAILCDQGKFLSRKSTPADADAYYAAIDKNNKRLTLEAWQETAGFNSINPKTDVNKQASYTNDNDLGFGRDMHILRNQFGVFAYVTNYLNSCRLQDPLNARLASQHKPEDAVATVCMEFSSETYDGKQSQGGADRIVKFFVYNEKNERSTLAALDPSGATPIPNLCVNCHGGKKYVAGGTTNLGASFLPFDLATFQYEPPDRPEFQPFKDLNDLVAETLPASSPIQDIIKGWYAAGGNKPNLGFAPGDWNDTPAKKKLYDLVVARGCRTCHAAFGTNGLSTWSTYSEFLEGRNVGSVINRTKKGNMPNALVTFMNLWTKNFWKDEKSQAALKCVWDNNDEAAMLDCVNRL